MEWPWGFRVNGYARSHMNGMVGRVVELQGNFALVDWPDGRTYTLKYWDMDAVEECECCGATGYVRVETREESG